MVTGTRPGALYLYPKQLAAHGSVRRPPALSAAAALLADSGSQQVLWSKDADHPRPNASTTKIMTALLALERADVASPVTVQPTALVGEASMGLVAGEVLTVEDLLWGLLLNSGNDAAMALAQHIGSSEAGFVTLMNSRAAELGLTRTHYANPHGIDAPGHVMSALDLWRLSETAMAQPLFRSIVSTQTASVAGHLLWNTNLLLDTYAGADGIKTGTTDLAGQCLVGSVTRDGHRVTVVLLGSDDRYADAATWLDHYFASYAWAAAPQPVGPAAWLRDPSSGRPYRVVAAELPDLFLPKWQWPLVRTQILFTGFPMAADQPAGAVRWYLGNELLAEAPALLSAY